MTTIHVPAPGDRVEFKPDTPQYPKNAGLTYVVVPSPSGEPYSIDNTRDEPRIYVWLVLAEDIDLAPSRQRRRTGLATALQTVA